MNNYNRNIRPLCTDANDPQRATMLSIITAKSCARIYIDDIEYIEQEGRKLNLVTVDLQYAVYDNINNLMPYFMSKNFFRAMKSVLINFDQIKNIDDSYVNFESGKYITMGRNNICKTRNAFKRYLQQYPMYYAPELKYTVAERSEDDLKY